MALRTFGALALSVSAASAFQGTSPLFLMSTSNGLDDFNAGSGQLASSSHAAQAVKKFLSGCPTDTYVVVNQPGVTAEDFTTNWAAPILGQSLKDSKEDTGTTSSSSSIREVVGGSSAESIVAYVEKQCKATRMHVDASSGYISLDDATPRVIKVDFTAPTTGADERASALTENDAFLAAVMRSVREGDAGASYSVIYATTPPSEKQLPAPKQQHPMKGYEMDEQFPPGYKTEMKRDLSATRGNATVDVALFEKYMFLSPGIFMGLSVTILLFLILYVGISAVAGLEVSYFAFTKEMGPAAQKKQQ